MVVSSNKIHYKLDKKKKTASIYGFSLAYFPEKIPETISYDGNIFKVDSISSINGLNLVQEKICIPDFITELRPRLFAKYHIKKLILGKELTYLPQYCFSFGKIEEIVFSKDTKIKTIDSCCFMRCEGLKHLDIPNSVNKIHSQAFYNCSDLESISLPDLDYLGDRAFKFCKNLSKVLFKNIFPVDKFKKRSFLEAIFPVKNGKIKIEFLVPEDNLQEIAESNIICDGKLHINSYCPSTNEYFSCLNYEIVDDNNCIVTYKLDENGNNVYTGDIIIPNKTIIGTKAYNVIGISDFAFFGCLGISSIEVPKNMDFDNISKRAVEDKDNCIIFKRS